MLYLDGNPVLMVNCSSMIRLFQINDMYFKTGMPIVSAFPVPQNKYISIFTIISRSKRSFGDNSISQNLQKKKSCN